MVGLFTPAEVGLAQRQRVIDAATQVFNDLLIVRWVEDSDMASIPKDDVRERLFTALGDKDSTTVELVSLMLEQVVDDYSVFGWDIEELDTMFVFRPGGDD